MVEFSVSIKNFDDIKKGRRFLVVDNTEHSLQNGDRVKLFEKELGKNDTGNWFVCRVVYVTNHNQRDNNIVFQFNIENDNNNGVQDKTRHG